MKSSPSKTVEDYLASLPKDQRIALTNLRKTIKSAAPQATEKISWRMPMFYHKGMLVAYAAFQEHCSFFGLGTSVMKKFEKELAPYLAAKSTLHFTPKKPLPAALVKKIVKERVKENEARRKK